MKKWHLIIDVEKCEDCNNCFLACKDEHVGNDWPGYSASQPIHGQRWIDISRKERGQYPLIDVAYRPLTCMHCAEAPCMKAGGDAVQRRSDGLVVIDPVKAKEKKNLVESCPYKVIWWNEEKEIPQKCSFCTHLLDQGWKAPRCVQACPTGALRCELLEDSELQEKIAAESLQWHRPEFGTKPQVYYKNMYRFDGCFIAGSVAVEKSGLVDCVKGAVVKLLRGEENLAETITDAFGDFKFDALPENSGDYRLEITHQDGRASCRTPVASSINVGVVMII